MIAKCRDREEDGLLIICPEVLYILYASMRHTCDKVFEIWGYDSGSVYVD